MANPIYINNKDLRQTWSAFLESGSYAELLAPPPMKDYIENNFLGQDGRQVLIGTPRVDSRDFNIQIVVNGESQADVLSNYESLLSELKKGVVDIRVPELGYIYHCVYKQATKLNNYSLNSITMNIVLYEPNPSNRTEIYYGGRYWSGSDPVGKLYGDAEGLRNLPEMLGLGRYLVTDDRVKRKLDPTDSTKFIDGRPAALDGSMGQCMWCWNSHYYTTWEEDDRTIETISSRPMPGKQSIYVPAGGISWMNTGVIDRTELKLCSLISDDSRYRGGKGNPIPDASAPDLSSDQPQKSMLGMAATSLPFGTFSTYARKHGIGWEANWFVARAVVEYTMRIILGERYTQAAFNPSLDADGLYHTGLGLGVVNMPDWAKYNNTHPIIPTSVGLRDGDMVGVINYDITKGDDTVVYKAPVPIFFGLVNPFGHLWSAVSGLILDVGATKSLAYIAPSMYAPFRWTSINGMLLAAEMPRSEGFIKKYSTNRLSCVPTEVGATSTTYFSDYFYSIPTSYSGLRCRLAGGTSLLGVYAGAFITYTYYTASDSSTAGSSPLCYFTEDPKIS